jgi:hypothetical protein
LKKCLRVPEEQLPLEEFDVQEDLTYIEHPVKIMDIVERITRSKRIRMCNAQDEATWEQEDELQAEFPQLFASPAESQGRDSF